MCCVPGFCFIIGCRQTTALSFAEMAEWFAIVEADRGTDLGCVQHAHV